MSSALKLLLSLLVGALASAGAIAAGYFAIGDERLGRFMFVTGAIPMLGPMVALAAAVSALVIAIAVGIAGARMAWSLMDRWWQPPPLGAFGVLMVLVAFAGIVTGPFYVRKLSAERAFAQVCTAAETTFHRVPASPVASIAHDWDPRWKRDAMAFAHEQSGMEHETRLARAYGGDVEFVEYPDKSGPPRKGFVRVRRGEWNEVPIPELTADVLVRYDASDYEALKEAPAHQGLIRYSLRVTDRRDGHVLATMTYLVDRKHRRICGAANSRNIDEAAFVARAIRPS